MSPANQIITTRWDFDDPSVEVDAFATSTACRDLNLWPSRCNQVTSRGWWLLPV